MSGGSQHNPNGRQSQLGSGWSPLQLQVASYLARAPQAHMASERGVTWHTPTPPHLYHVPAPSPPDPLQAMKVGAGANAAFRHTATPPDLYRHTPTPPDKHLMRHTPSPGDVKGGPIPPPDIYQHLGQARDKLVRPEDMLSYARGGVDLTLGRSAAANGAPIALSVRDAPTINSLIARAQPLPHPRPHPRVDSLLERLAPSPVSPHSVIVHPRGPATPSPPDSNEDSADSCGAPPGSKRKRKPERVVRVPSVPPPLTPPDPIVAPPKPPERPPEPKPQPVSRLSPPKEAEPEKPDAPLENGETHATSNGPEPPEKTDPPEAEPHTRRKTRSGSAETIDDIAAMIASTDKADGKDEPEKPTEAMEIDAPVTIDKLKSVLASPEPEPKEAKIEEPKKSPPKTEEPIADPVVEAAAAPKRRRARSSKDTSESTNVPVESPSEAKPAEAEASEAKSAEAEAKSAEPVPASIVDVEDQLEKMFAGIEEEPGDDDHPGKETDSATALPGTAKGKKRRKSVATKGEKKVSRRSSRASTGDEATKRKAGRKRGGGAGAGARGRKNNEVREYDSGSNASSGRSRGPYIQIRGPRDSPLSVSVINAATGEEEETAGGGRRKGGEEFRNGLRTRGLHCSTLGLRYDATTPDASWVCAFCERGPHSPPASADFPLPHRPLGDLFGPYTVSTDCEEFRALDEATRKKRAPVGGDVEVWFHEECAVWAPGLLAWGARVWGLPSAVWGAAGARCGACGRGGAGLACARHACAARSHAPCARAAGWHLSEAQYRALCPRHGSG